MFSRSQSFLPLKRLCLLKTVPPTKLNWCDLEQFFIGMVFDKRANFSLETGRNCVMRPSKHSEADMFGNRSIINENICFFLCLFPIVLWKHSLQRYWSKTTERFYKCVEKLEVGRLKLFKDPLYVVFAGIGPWHPLLANTGKASTWNTYRRRLREKKGWLLSFFHVERVFLRFFYIYIVHQCTVTPMRWPLTSAFPYFPAGSLTLLFSYL